MKRVTTLGLLMSIGILFVGCSTNNEQTQQINIPENQLFENQKYISKDEFEIPDRGKITVLNQGITQDDDGADVYQLSLKQELSPKENDIIGLNFEQNGQTQLKKTIGYYQYETKIISLVNKTNPIIFSIKQGDKIIAEKSYSVR
ncbi:hypothetical protein R4Y45_04200 [Holzapfeliella sp. He02]|uniref:Lipoprotein n=1 Tax=Holzapfeliella saturejae TaxID=3082953 RepID=A0ABU8SGD3_9LACO